MKALCVLSYLEMFLDRGNSLRTQIKTTAAPLKAVSVNSIRNWIKSVLLRDSMSISVFKPHSLLKKHLLRSEEQHKEL